MNEPMKEHMYIIKASCYKCKTPLNIAIIDRDLKNSSMRGPESFSSEEIKIAQNNDVVIKEHHSYTMDTNYHANTCPSCNAFIGQHFLHEYLIDAIYGDYEHKKIDLI